MNALSMLSRVLIVSFLAVARAVSEPWATVGGEAFDGRLSGVYGPLVVIATENGSRRVVAEALTDAGVARVADFLASRPKTRPKWTESRSPVAAALKGKLGMLRAAKLVSFDEKDAEEPEFYVVFFGAGANEGTRRFAPQLVPRYGALKGKVGSLFEVIYLGRDGVPEDHTRFIRETEMPWPFVRFSAFGSVKVFERWSESGIPSVVVLNAAGDLVLDSIRSEGGFYSPDEVFREFEALLVLMTGESPTAKRAMHRLAILQHLRACPTGMHPPRPYVLGLDRSAYSTISTQRIVATLSLDDRGKVTEVSLDPKQDAVLMSQFTQDTGRWLFLPSVNNGKPQPYVVKVPIEF